MTNQLNITALLELLAVVCCFL